MMKFDVEFDETDALVLLDEEILSELNSDLMYALDILLDHKGTSELIYDFPNENWNAVRCRKTEILKKFCDSGKMIIWLSEQGEKNFEIKNVLNVDNTNNYLNAQTGTIICVSASELIQCIEYPELEMEKLFEIKTDVGWYAFKLDDPQILYSYQERVDNEIKNVVDL
ncbi:MAG: hypothetical protein IJ583_08240 [Firmicutes bacterium]|nr:hypothetical protein [Bacillota bacterium]